MKKLFILVMFFTISIVISACAREEQADIIGSWVWEDLTWGVGIFYINQDNTGSFVTEGVVEYTFTWERPREAVFSINTIHWGLETFSYEIADNILTIQDIRTGDIFRYMRQYYFEAGGQF